MKHNKVHEEANSLSHWHIYREKKNEKVDLTGSVQSHVHVSQKM